MSDDPDLVVTSVDPSLGKIGKHELRRKLVSFLAVSLPPIPLNYMTFQAHIKNQCETYYDSVIRDVYESLTAQWNRRLYLVESHDDLSSNTRVPADNDLITISSEDESESENRILESKKDELVEPEPEESEKKIPELKKDEPAEPESDKHKLVECKHKDYELEEPATSNNCDTSVPRTLPDACEKRTPAFTDQELIAFKAEKSTKKYTRYLQETYNLIKNIEGTTSCNICCKLKRRIQKFVLLVGQESAVIQQKVAKELRAHQISPRGNLTETALEKMRMSLLIDKLIEISIPDILKEVESMAPKNDDVTETVESKTNGMKKGKKESIPDSTSADVNLPQVKAGCSTEPSSHAMTKKRSKKGKTFSDDSESYKKMITKRPSHASLNGSCSVSEDDVSLESKKSTAKKKGKKISNVEETSMWIPRAKARKISIKISDSSHPDLNL